MGDFDGIPLVSTGQPCLPDEANWKDYFETPLPTTVSITYILGLSLGQLVVKFKLLFLFFLPALYQQIPPCGHMSCCTAIIITCPFHSVHSHAVAVVLRLSLRLR